MELSLGMVLGEFIFVALFSRCSKSASALRGVDVHPGPYHELQLL